MNMNREDAEAFTETLGSIVGASWKQIAWGYRMGIPDALGLSIEEWVAKLGGYVKLSIKDRREAVAELTDEGLTTRDIGGILGVSHQTVIADSTGAIGNNRPQLPLFDQVNNHVVQVLNSIGHMTSMAERLTPEELSHIRENIETIRERIDFLLIQIGEGIHG